MGKRGRLYSPEFKEEAMSVPSTGMPFRAQKTSACAGGCIGWPISISPYSTKTVTKFASIPMMAARSVTRTL